MKQHQKVVLTLGAAGLLPFLLTPVLVLYGYEVLGQNVARLYGLAIICFLAGSWWGIVLVATRLTSAQRTMVLIISNLVVIVAVGGLLSLVPSAGLVLLAALLVVQLVIERSVKGLARQPRYYSLMRTALSAVAATCLLMVAGIS